jgi:hypothetical protein
VHASHGSASGSEQNSREQSGSGAGKGRRRDPRARRPRWLLLAAGIVGIAGLVAGVSAPERLTNTGSETAAKGNPGADWNISELSDGAPTGAITIPDAPVTTVAAQPAGTTVVNGLAANGIPNVALNAYRVAAARMGTAQPGCGIHWSLLAGIGRIESNHGRFGGAVLNSDGTSSPEIRGPALNGINFAFIGDSDNGTFDHDPTYDRAVGPMQFIPTTWRSYAIDADGNHTTDPFDIDDAALGAAHYLCVAGGNLTTLAGQREAVMAYNHSDSYVAQVLALAHAYASGIPVDDLPLMGNTVSPVPPPTGFYQAPVNPGPSIGAKDMTPASGPTAGQSGATAGGAGGAAPAQEAAAPAGPAGGDPAAPPATGTAPNPATAPGQPAPAPAPGPAAPAPGPALPLPTPNLPAPPPVVTTPPPVIAPPPTTTTPLVPGETCTLLGLGGVKLIPTLPVCPPGS